MAHRHNNEGDYSPKHRIVGAVVIVSLAVIFLPMILSEEQAPPKLAKKTLELNEIPQPDTKVFRLPTSSIKDAESQVPTAELTDQKDQSADEQSEKTKGETASGDRKQDASERIVAKSSPQKGMTHSESSAKTGQKSALRSSRSASSGKKRKGWVVQVGTFSNNDNVERLRQRLKESGFLVSLEDVALKGRKAVRVRVGPFRQKHVAMKAQSKIHKEIGLKGVVLAQH